MCCIHHVNYCQCPSVNNVWGYLYHDVLRYVSSIKQSAAGAAIASVQATMFVSAGVLIMVSSVAVQAIGIGPFFTIMAGLQALSATYSFCIIFFKRKASHARRTASTADLTSHLA